MSTSDSSPIKPILKFDSAVSELHLGETKGKRGERLKDNDGNLDLRVHNRFSRVFVDTFGSGTVDLFINGEKYIVNKGSLNNQFGTDEKTVEKRLANLLNETPVEELDDFKKQIEENNSLSQEKKDCLLGCIEGKFSITLQGEIELELNKIPLPKVQMIKRVQQNLNLLVEYNKISVEEYKKIKELFAENLNFKWVTSFDLLNMKNSNVVYLEVLNSNIDSNNIYTHDFTDNSHKKILEKNEKKIMDSNYYSSNSDLIMPIISQLSLDDSLDEIYQNLQKLIKIAISGGLSKDIALQLQIDYFAGFPEYQSQIQQPLQPQVFPQQSQNNKFQSQSSFQYNNQLPNQQPYQVQPNPNNYPSSPQQNTYQYNNHLHSQSIQSNIYNQTSSTTNYTLKDFEMSVDSRKDQRFRFPITDYKLVFDDKQRKTYQKSLETAIMDIEGNLIFQTNLTQDEKNKLYDKFTKLNHSLKNINEKIYLNVEDYKCDLGNIYKDFLLDFINDPTIGQKHKWYLISDATRESFHKYQAL